MDFFGARKRADKKLKKDGRTITLSLSTAASYNPVTGVKTTESTTTYSAYAVEADYNQNQRDGTIVQAKDKKFILSALQTNGEALPEITTAYKLVTENKTFEIVNIYPVKPGTISVMYEVQCRG